MSDPIDVEFTSSVDGSAQKYVVLPPKSFDPSRQVDLLICLHGHGSDRWQYVNDPRGECRGARDVAQKHGIIFVSPDYRARTSWMGPKAEADILQIIGGLKQRYTIGKTILSGASMGGTSALIFTALHPHLIDGVCSQNGTANMLEYTNFLEFIAESYGGTKESARQEYQKRSPELVPERFTMPIAFTLGGKDDIVPPQSVLRLAQAIQQCQSKVLMIYRESVGHETDYADTVEAYEYVVQGVRNAP